MTFAWMAFRLKWPDDAAYSHWGLERVSLVFLSVSLGYCLGGNAELQGAGGVS
jgi:hypothetical protein